MDEVANTTEMDALVKEASEFNPAMEISAEQKVAELVESTIVRQTPCDPFIGPMLATLRNSLGRDGSELGTGVFLFGLAVAIRAKMILEIGRNLGFTTFAFASALKFMEQGWDEYPANRQRPDIDYTKHESREPGFLFSLDINPATEVATRQLLDPFGLDKYVRYVNADSQASLPTDIYDIMLIDGLHTFEGCLKDVQRYVPFLRPGGYFIVHDYYGWYQDGVNHSPIKAVCERITGDVKSLLIDTGYQSFVVFRKEQLLFPVTPNEKPFHAHPQADPLAGEMFVVE